MEKFEDFTLYKDRKPLFEQEQYDNKLTIEYDKDSFSFSIAKLQEEKQTYKIIALGDYTPSDNKNRSKAFESAKYLFNNNDFLSRMKFKSIEIIHKNAAFTLVPTNIVDSSKLSNYVAFTEQDKPDFGISIDEISEINVCSIYRIDNEIEDFFCSKTKRISSKHSISAFIEIILKDPRYKQGSNIHLNIRNSKFEIVAFKDGKLLLAVLKNYLENNDISGYIRSIIPILGLEVHDLTITSYGEAEKILTLQPHLISSFPKVKLGQRSDQYEFSDALDLIACYEYYNVLNI